MDAVKLCHALPDSAHLDYERRLQRIATRGGVLKVWHCISHTHMFSVFSVVQVFNAVHKQQQELEAKLKEVGSSESKRSKGRAPVTASSGCTTALTGTHDKRSV